MATAAAAEPPPAPRTPGAPAPAPGGGSPLLAALAGQRARYAARGMGATDWAGRLAGISAVSAPAPPPGAGGWGAAERGERRAEARGGPGLGPVPAHGTTFTCRFRSAWLITFSFSSTMLEQVE